MHFQKENWTKNLLKFLKKNFDFSQKIRKSNNMKMKSNTKIWVKIDPIISKKTRTFQKKYF